MSDGELLGRAVLELTTDERPLNAGLIRAERRVALSTQAMGASIDKQALAMGGSFAKAGTQADRQLTPALARAQRASRAAATETRTLAAETGLSSRAFSDLSSHMGPVGRGMTDLTARSRLYRQHGIDYLAAGVIGLEAAFVGLSVRAAVRFEDLGRTVQRQTGLSGRSLDHLMGVIRTVGRDSPYQMQQVADASVILRKEFHETDAQIGRSANLMIAFANAAGNDVRPQMQQLQRIMTQFRAPLKDVVGLTDKLTAVSQATQQPIGAVVNTLDKFGPKLSALGFGLNDSVRLLALFQASGIKTEAMGRGLSAALTAVTKAQGENQKLIAGGPAKLDAYSSAVQTAQLRVDTLSARLQSGKGNQQLLNEQMTIAQGKLDAAKQKYDGLNEALKKAKGAHADIAQSIHSEIVQITNAHSKQDALNIAIADFGKNLGPSMARALYNNSSALAEVDKALHKTGTTQRLFGVDQASIAGKTQEAKNNFQDLEITIGTKVVPALSDLLGVVRDGVHDIDTFVKHNQTLVEVLGGVAGGFSAITLLSRHTPLGGLLGGLAQKTGHGGIASVLTGSGAGSRFYGVRGPVAAGSLTNPIAVATEEGRVAGLGSRAAPGTIGAGGAAAEVTGKAAALGALSTIGGIAGIALIAGMTAKDLLNKPIKVAAGSSAAQTSSAINAAGAGFAAPELIAKLKKEGAFSAKAFDEAGRQAASAFDQGLKQVKDPTAFAFAQDFVMKLRTLPAATRTQAAKTMIAFASELEANGKLPKGSVSKIIASLEQQFPALTGYLKQQGLQTNRDWAQALKFTEAQSNLKHTFQSIRSQFGLFTLDPNVTGKNLLANVGKEYEDLQSVVRSSTGQARADAKKAMGGLKDDTRSTLDTMLGQVNSRIGSMRDAIATGSHDAQIQAGQNFGTFAGQVEVAMKSGALSTSAGSKLIRDALQSTLKAFGSKQQIPAVVSVDVGSVSAAASAAVGSVQNIFGLAHGGLMQIGRPGQAGRDTVPLNVGGTPIMVAPGEQVAVFNRHQIGEANARFADWGGLGGYFAGNAKPNYMAQGGIVAGGRYATGGLGSPGAVNPSGVESYAQLEGLWNQFGGNPAAAPLAAAIAEAESSGRINASNLNTNGTIDRGLWQINSIHGAQSTFDVAGNTRAAIAISSNGSNWTPWTTFNTGAYRQFLQGGVPASAGSLAGGPGAASVAFKTIKTPTVTGSGAIPDIVRATLAMETAAANRVGQAAAAKQNAGASAGGGGGASSGPGGLATFEGVLMSQWIANELMWGTQHGWHGQPTSGYRPGRDPHTSSGLSEHALIAYPGGAVDFGGYVDPGAYATKLALVQLAARLNYPGPRLQMPIGFSDDGHLSGSGHAQGGWVRTGATIDPTQGQAPTFSAHGGMSFAELLEAGSNAGMRPDLTQLLGLPRSSFGMPMETPILVRMPGGGGAFEIWKNDVGSGQRGNPHYTIDLHQAIANALHWTPNGDVEVARLGATSKTGSTSTASAPKPGWGGMLPWQGDKHLPAGSPITTSATSSAGERFLPAGPGTAAWGYRKTNRGRWLPASHKFPNAPAGALAGGAGGGGAGGAPVETLAGYGTHLGDLEADRIAKSAQYTSLSGRFGAIEGDPKFLNADGSTSAAGIAQQISDTQALLNLANAIEGDYQQELPLVSNALTQFLGARSGTQGQIAADQARIASNKKKLAANKVKEGSLRAAILALGRPSKDEVGAIAAAIKAAKLKYDPAVKAAERAKAAYHGKDKATRNRLSDAVIAAKGVEAGVLAPLNESMLAAQGSRSQRKSQVAAEKFHLRTQLGTLSGEDLKLTQADAAISGSIASLKQILTGAGGQQGENATIKSLEEVAATLGTVNWGKGGEFQSIDTFQQGAAFDEQTTIDQLQNTLTTLGGTAATASAAQSDTVLAGLLQTQLQQANQALAVSQAQYKVLANLPPYVGSYDKGGTIPGAIGQPMLATVHGGEVISRPDSGSGDVHFIQNFKPGTEWLRDLISTEVVKGTRSMARNAGRILPGAGGGLIRN